MKNKNHPYKETAQKAGAKKTPFLESLKKGCLVISEKIREKVRYLPGSLLKNSFAVLFFVVVWTLLAFYEDGLLFRVNELSLFLYDDLYYEEMMSVPAGLLSYIACYLIQFFYNPVVGATIYVGLLVLVYWLTYKVFDVSHRYRLFAMMPVIALLASNTQLGYWIFYLKLPGYYYVALLGVIVSLLAAWIVKKSHIYLKPLLVAAWMYFAYPYLGVYAIASGVVMGVHSLCLAIGRRYNAKKIAISSVSIVVSVVMYNIVPGAYYNDYTTVPSEEMLTAGLPASQWKSEYVPSKAEKEAALSVISGVNGRVGYPIDKDLIAYKMNVDGSFSQKSIETVKSNLLANGNINRPVAGKVYTFTFIAKNGKEYFLNQNGENVSFVEKEGNIPRTGHFVCASNNKMADVHAFRTLDGKYLAWNVDLPSEHLSELPVDSLQTASDAEPSSGNVSPLDMTLIPDGTPVSIGVVASISDGNTRCMVVKMKREKGVDVADNSKLFGVVNLHVFDKNTELKDGARPLFVAGLSDGVLRTCSEVQFNDTLSTALRVEEVGYAPAPFSLAMTERTKWYDMNTYWVPFWLLFIAFVVLAIVPAVPYRLPEFTADSRWLAHLIPGFVALYLVAFSCVYWYKNENFHIENEQNMAMWNEDWERVAELSRDTDEPTRQVVMNKNIALLKLGRSGDGIFTYPEGSADIEAPMPVRLTQTGGKMVYYQYGKFNFCYRWCVEDAVEYGWRVEYLKHAVRSMLLSGEYKLAKRYIKILKRTKYYADWASDMEKYISDPQLLKSAPEFKMPLDMACYGDALDVDESYVEAYLTKNLTNSSEKMSRTYVDAALASALTRKDSRMFWSFLNYYVNTFYVNEPSVKKLPVHYQEAVLLFLNLDKGKTVQVPQAFLDRFVSKKTETRMSAFMARVAEHKGKREEQMAPFFKDDFGDTYFYFYFFVRNIKTN